MGGDCFKMREKEGKECFNPRPRMGGDRLYSESPVLLIVSIHAPAWGATSLIIVSISRFPGFNPRPRMGGDSSVPSGQLLPSVSIHAPAWGATKGTYGYCGPKKVSIHAPAWGATKSDNHTGKINAGFNPRPRMGGDDIAIFANIYYLVSIHAPAWGATHGLDYGKTVRPGFNPRPRMGGDVSRDKGICLIHVSIHAPAWGATPTTSSFATFHSFQSTPPHGGRRWKLRNH